MDPFKICYVSAEVAPFSRSGRLGDLPLNSRELPVALKEMGQDVRLMMPKYKSINERKYTLREVIRLREVTVPLADDTKVANGKTAFLPDSKVHVYFLSFPEYFDRKGGYGDPGAADDYPDNAERFAFFCKGVLETLKLLYWQPDVIHCADWPTGLIPYYLKTVYRDDPFFENTQTVLTVHNFAEQGRFSVDSAAAIAIDEDHLGPDGPCVHDGDLNFLKAGLIHADIIHVPGKVFADTLLSNPADAHGLGAVVQARKDDLVGIAGGANALEWDPASDKRIAERFDLDTLEKKDDNKASLQEELELSVTAETPLVAVSTDGADPAELEVVLKALPDILKTGAQVVVQSRKAAPLADDLRKLAGAHNGQFAYVEKADAKLQHLLLAGADLTLIPSASGLTGDMHLRGLRYGAVPVLVEAGVYPEQVTAYDPGSGEGHAFWIPKFNKTAVVRSMKDALAVVGDNGGRDRLRENALRARVAWTDAARQFLAAYERAADKR